jgi:phage terminase large subunit-like protein
MGVVAGKLTGKTQPRIWTEPRATLTRRNSLGYAVAEFADAIGQPLLPWQRWLMVHALELDKDKNLRYRVVLPLVARQNGKTTCSSVLALYSLYVRRARLVLGTAQDVSIAREVMENSLEMVRASIHLAEGLGRVYKTNGAEYFTLRGGGRYKISAANRKAGRGLSVDLLLCDEIAQWHSVAPWAALMPTTMARASSQVWCPSNMGDDNSVVLNTLRESALAGRDSSVGLFEWSAEDGCDLYDVQAWRQANPALGYTMTPRAIRSAIDSSTPDVARTEILCQKVDLLNAAISMSAWAACADPAGSMEDLKTLPCAAGFDISPDSQHATLAVAGRTGDGRARLVIAQAWKNTDTARAELPALLRQIKPQAVAWYPTGPAGAFASILGVAGNRSRCEYIDLTGVHAANACQEFADLVTGHRIIHPGDQLLDHQLRGASKLKSADGWRFTRSGAGHVDAAYAAAAAVTAALKLPEPRRARIRLLDAG